MATNLRLLLARNKKSLVDFCKNNRINSYESFVEYCHSKNIQPCFTRREYNEVIEASVSVEEVDVKEKKSAKRKAKKGKPSSS